MSTPDEMQILLYDIRDAVRTQEPCSFSQRLWLWLTLWPSGWQGVSYDDPEISARGWVLRQEGLNKIIITWIKRRN